MLDEAVQSQARVVAPWVEEHPDVFNDPDFSVSMTANNTCHADDMEVSLPQDKYMDLPNVSVFLCICVHADIRVCVLCVCTCVRVL